MELTSMNQCSGQRVSEYLDGDLSPSDARAMETHLLLCAECRQTLRDFVLIADASQAMRLHRSVARSLVSHERRWQA
jgi:anti-sigma factor RsiW